MKELKKALSFSCTLECWRMAIFWTLSLVISYFQLFLQRILTGKSNAYPRCPSPRIGKNGPICIITGVSYNFCFFLELSCYRFFFFYEYSYFGYQFIFFWFVLLPQATSGIGEAAAYALSKKGFFVVLGTSALSYLLIILFYCFLIVFGCMR